MKHFRVVFKPDGREISIHQGASLLEAARQAGIILTTPCGGKGTCGKCALQLHPSGQQVLACQHQVQERLGGGGPAGVALLRAQDPRSRDRGRSRDSSDGLPQVPGRGRYREDSRRCGRYRDHDRRCQAARHGQRPLSRHQGRAEPADPFRRRCGQPDQLCPVRRASGRAAQRHHRVHQCVDRPPLPAGGCPRVEHLRGLHRRQHDHAPHLPAVAGRTAWPGPVPGVVRRCP